MNQAVEWIQSWTNHGKLAIIFFPIICGILFYFSTRMVKWSQIIIAKTKFGGGFVGGVLIGTITSMPELVTELTQAASGTPENGVGDDIGSNAFAMLLISIGAVIYVKQLFLNNLGRWTKITLCMAFVITLAFGLTLFFGEDLFLGSHTFAIGLIPLTFFAFYIATIFLNYWFGDHDEEPIDENFVNKHSLSEGVARFSLAAFALIVTAIILNLNVSAFSAPDALNIPSESAGGIFLAITTSLPEIVAFFIFIKMKHTSAALSSAVSSQFFNLGISFFGDLMYTGHHGVHPDDEPTFTTHAVDEHFPLALVTAIMIGVTVIHFLVAAKWPNVMKQKRFYLIAPITAILTYVFGWVFILVL